MVERADGWKTQDGVLFEREQDAVDHEAFMKIKQFAADAGLMDDEESGDGAGVILWRHRDRILEILTPATPATDLERTST